jgi:NADPH:quinone reductase-like Zn-dependent oxidoreductase
VPHQAHAWFLHPAKAGEHGRLGELVREPLTLRDPNDDELLVEPLYGCWGANMQHAIERKPVDLCALRSEPRVVLGNAAVVRVLSVGAALRGLHEGQLGMIFSASVLDRWGYCEKAFAYDAPGTIGCLSTRTILRQHEFLPLPEGTRYSLMQWAAFSGSYITAWSNWAQAYGSYRLMVPEAENPAPHVWGWGGGTTFAELDLARRHGCRTVMLSSSPTRRGLIERAGIAPLDRAALGELNFDERRFATDGTYRRAYLEGEARLLRAVDERTGGDKVQIFIDYIGTPVARVTLKALGRQGIITTAGWREGMVMSFLRAVECIGRHQHVHTHYARLPQGREAMAYGEAHGWMPPVDERIFGFDEVPELARHAAAGSGGFYSIFAINPV